jgi:dipeptidyl aminopeptidase/acylaminoacyl peptidase
MSFQSLKETLTNRLYGARTVKKQLALLVVGLVTVLVLAGQLARAGSPLPLRNDSDPYWSSDAREVAFDLDGSNAATIAAGHGGESPVAAGFVRGWRPGGAELLVQIGSLTEVLTPDRRRLGTVNGNSATWSPDGGRIAYLRNGALYVSDATGAHEHRLADRINRPADDTAGPVWSPDGSRIAISDTVALLVVRTDGSGSQLAGPAQGINPSWSPDGETIAFERNDGVHWLVWLVGTSGENAHAITPSGSDARFPQWSPMASSLAFISDRSRIPGGATPYQYALYVQPAGSTTPTKVLDDVQPLTPARWSPTGAQLAAAAGQECRRFGIYVVSPAAPRRAQRRSNLCRFDGTGGNDVLTGTPYYDRLRGLGGNDRISGGAGSDRIEGNNGNDVIDAGSGDNAVFGGPGNDTIRSGGGNDLIVGGPGNDRISAAAGNDRLETRDGSRDVIDCGPGRDTAEVDRLDVVLHCETVLRG